MKINVKIEYVHVYILYWNQRSIGLFRILTSLLFMKCDYVF